MINTILDTQMLEEKLGGVLNFAWGGSGRFLRIDDSKAAYK